MSPASRGSLKQSSRSSNKAKKPEDFDKKRAFKLAKSENQVILMLHRVILEKIYNFYIKGFYHGT
jgi:hypothetical protein